METKILIVDDEVDIQYLITQKFKKEINEGVFKFFFALNGSEALKILEENTDLSIILTDINMPVMDGLTLLQNLPKLNRPYKAIVVSAYGDLSNIRIAMNRGASDFIMKPIDFIDFQKTMQKIIDEYSMVVAAINTEKNLKEIQIELNVAKSIQASMLPSNFQPFPDYPIEITGKAIPAKFIGGDYFDFFAIDDHRLAIIIADVSGKSISACLYMSITKALFRAFSHQHLSCIEVMNQLDSYLSSDNEAGMFVTAIYGILDINTGQFSYCNAGHDFPYLIKEKEVIKTELIQGRTLGIRVLFGQMAPSFEEKTMILEDGDCLFFYTDGITEAWNKKEELFSNQRLKALLNDLKGEKTDTIVDAVVKAVNDFNDTGLQSDDLTLLAIRYYKKNRSLA